MNLLDRLVALCFVSYTFLTCNIVLFRFYTCTMHLVVSRFAVVN